MKRSADDDEWSEVVVPKKKKKKKKKKRRRRGRDEGKSSDDEDVEFGLVTILSGLIEDARGTSDVNSKVAFEILPEPVRPLKHVTMDHIRKITTFFYGTFRVAENKDLMKLPRHERVSLVVALREGGRSDLMTVYMSIFDMMKNPTRLVQAFDMYSKNILASWVEVWSLCSSEWIAVDPMRNIVTRSCHEMLPSFDTVTHVVAAERVGVLDKIKINLVDVTKTYVSSKWWSKCRKRREWIESNFVQLLNGLSSSASSSSSVISSSTAKMNTKTLTTTKIFPTTTNNILMPTTMFEFRKHPTLCLESHLDRSHIIRDEDRVKARVGLFKGHDVYLRSFVKPLLSVEGWFRKHARVVRHLEIKNPVREFSRSNKKRSMTTTITTSSTTTLPLPPRRVYGEWQTDLYKPPAVKDNRVPTNEYGNVEMWTPKHTPIGAKHLTIPHAEEAAKSMNIHYVRALVGFEKRDGRVVPRYDGIVVCDNVVSVLEDISKEKERQRMEYEKLRRRAKIIVRWETLARGLLDRAFVDAQYESTKCI